MKNEIFINSDLYRENTKNKNLDIYRALGSFIRDGELITGIIEYLKIGDYFTPEFFIIRDHITQKGTHVYNETIVLKGNIFFHAEDVHITSIPVHEYPLKA